MSGRGRERLRAEGQIRWTKKGLEGYSTEIQKKASGQKWEGEGKGWINEDALETQSPQIGFFKR